MIWWQNLCSSIEFRDRIIKSFIVKENQCLTYRHFDKMKLTPFLNN